MRLTNGIPLGCQLPLTITTINYSKHARYGWHRGTEEASQRFSPSATEGGSFKKSGSAVSAMARVWQIKARGAVRVLFGRNLHSKSAVELHAFAPLEARPCVLFGRDLHPKSAVELHAFALLSCTPLLRLKRGHACNQRHSSQVFIPLTSSHCKLHSSQLFTPLTGWHCTLRPNSEGKHYADETSDIVVVPPLRTDMVDIIGAADAAVGGLTAALAERLPMRYAMIWATACGTLSCRTVGVRCAFLDRIWLSRMLCYWIPRLCSA
jgi:hypothetical protein